MPNCEVISSNFFDKALKQLAKRHASIHEDVLKLIERLEQQPATGKPFGGGVYKVRLAIKSKGKGKRGGGRVITYHIVRKELLYLLTIYDKADQATISEAEIEALVKNAISERDPGLQTL